MTSTFRIRDDRAGVTFRLTPYHNQSIPYLSFSNGIFSKAIDVVTVFTPAAAQTLSRARADLKVEKLATGWNLEPFYPLCYNSAETRIESIGRFLRANSVPIVDETLERLRQHVIAMRPKLQTLAN